MSSRWADGVPVLFARPAARLSLPDSLRGFPVHTVATDASLSASTGALGWAAVTGAGWLRSGAFVMPQEGANSGLGELLAVIEGIRFYPGGSTVNVLCDSEGVCVLLQRAIDRPDRSTNRTRAKRRAGISGTVFNSWIPGEATQDLTRLIAERDVNVFHLPRNSNELMRLADKEARRAALSVGLESAADFSYCAGQRW